MCFIQHEIHICTVFVKMNDVLSNAGTVKRKCLQDSIVWQHNVSYVREDFQSWCVSYNQTFFELRNQLFLYIACPPRQCYTLLKYATITTFHIPSNPYLT